MRTVDPLSLRSIFFKAIFVRRADFKLIAKALARMGNALRRQGELDKAKVAYEKALTEHRTPEYRTALSEVCKGF